MPASYKHLHEQTVAAAEWNINHNLNTLAPVCDCFITLDDKVQKILPVSVEVIDSMNLKIVWSIARTGYCSII